MFKKKCLESSSSPRKPQRTGKISRNPDWLFGDRELGYTDKSKPKIGAFLVCPKARYGDVYTNLTLLGK